VALVGLVLEVAEFAGPRRWRWLLTDEDTGQPLADHQVSLEAETDEFAAFTSLYRYLRWHAVPDRRTASEAEIVARVGAWAGAAVLGKGVGQAIVDAAPVTVQVQVPARAGFVLGWPLELAHAGGQPLAARGDVTMVYDLGVPPGGAMAGGRAAGAELRMLAVFSLPTQTSVLALRRERHELAHLIRRIGARQGRRVSLSLLQYGVTRDRLGEVVDSGDGWDVLHLSGHGGRGVFLLERDDGSPDEVGTGELVKMLRPLRRRVRLAVVSACESAAATMAETLRWVGLDDQAEQLEQEDRPASPDGVESDQSAEPEAVTGIARALVEQLGCAAVAMRYPVTDEFATAFTTGLYERVFGRDQVLGTALARAVAESAGPQPSPARPAICLATPVLVGRLAAGLKLNAPAGKPGLDPAEVKMERFPPEPERFVGRAQAMAQASAALAPKGGLAGVLLYGMAGSGKTACALELAYRHQDSFAATVFWQAPETDDEFGEALTRLAAALDIQLGAYGFAMSDHITPIESLEEFVPRLRRLLEDNGILLVLDNLETLLTPDGDWRDPRWAPLIAAMTGHRGESRVIVTSRIPPAGLGHSMLDLPVHALSLDESAALARELPGLRGLLHADSGPLRDADESLVARDRGLVRRVLHVVQGHPKLMELADAAAADPARLADQLDGAESAAAGQVLDAFFRDGTTRLDAAQFLDTLSAWTTDTLTALPEPAQLMARFLACLEDDDRNSIIVEASWADLWQRLARPGDPPSPAPPLAALTAAALIQADTPVHDGTDGLGPVLYRMHPGVAQAIHASTAADMQAATDTELAAFWEEVLFQARQQESGETGQIMVHAGLAAAPYLLRLKEWDTAGALLDQTLRRDYSPVTIQAALPALRAIADATHSPDDLAILARALTPVDPVEAEALLRGALTQATGEGDFQLASGIASALANLLMAAGKLREALDIAGQKLAEYDHQADLGPWTRLGHQALKLQILGQMGEQRQVLDQIPELRAQMDKLHAAEGSNETVEPWNIRETIFDVGRSSALALGEWQLCLSLNTANLASKRARGASTYEITRFRYNDSGPLIRLGRLDEAEQLLIECQQVYEDQGDLGRLARVFANRAYLEDERGNMGAALAFQQTAVRFCYARADARDIAAAHTNLASILQRTGSDPAALRAHRLAGALIYQLTGMTHNLAAVCQMLAGELRRDGGDARHLPGTLDEVVSVAEQTEGVHLGELITAVQPDRQAAADILAQILRATANNDPEQDTGIQGHLQQWEPYVTLTVAAAGGNQEAAAELMPVLDHFAQTKDWAALVAVLRRILDGERADGLLDGLDPIDTAIAAQVLARLTPTPPAPRQEHP
jgi:tetratricopeptide (TPR) repeat protein